ncbi:hypothetical protein [Candidatus Leptofilum sp.]|uniref:hypothetical protein n=1 Tax=Candidatus Leptofilum sp. TaxID=3241576 RepID=UPI003B5982F8
MKWNDLTSNKPFITNLDKLVKVKIDEDKELSGRYAVWQPTDDKRHAIVEVSSDLSYLINKYKVNPTMVFRVNSSK